MMHPAVISSNEWQTFKFTIFDPLRESINVQRMHTSDMIKLQQHTWHRCRTSVYPILWRGYSWTGQSGHSGATPRYLGV